MKKFIKIDALNCVITETVEQSKNFTVDGVTALKKEYEDKLKVINDAIVEMKKAGCDFSKHEETPEEEETPKDDGSTESSA